MVKILRIHFIVQNNIYVSSNTYLKNQITSNLYNLCEQKPDMARPCQAFVIKAVKGLVFDEKFIFTRLYIIIWTK